MFEDSLLSASAPVRSSAVRVASVVSLGVQGAVAAVLCALPMFHPLALRVPTPAAPLFVPSLHQQPPKPRLRVDAAPVQASVLPSRTLATHAPVIQRVHVAEVPETAATPALLPFGASTLPEAALRGAEARTGAVPTGGAAMQTATMRGPVRVSSGVSAGLLLTPIRPVYPQIARSAHVEGTVLVHAVISREGNVVQASVTAGPAMLAEAALDAVRTARYRPFRLNGEPTEVDTTFSIVFRLGSL